MKGIVAAVGLAALSLPAAADDGVVQWDFERQKNPGRRISRRASSVEETISNEVMNGGYFASVSIGTPGQALSLQLDTGSSDIWVPYSGAESCQGGQGILGVDPGSEGCKLGSFDPDESKSFEDTGRNEFVIKYVDGSGARGDYFEDNFQIGGVTIKNLTMGIALETDLTFGLVGVGYTINEAATATDYDQYPNLPVAMRDSGFIKTIAYSLWLNDLDASKGSILFGGIDTEKYQGELKVLDIIPDAKTGKYFHFNVPMTGLRGVSSTGADYIASKELPIVTILDSGTTLTYLPQDMCDNVWKEVGAVWYEDSKAALVPCSLANNDGYFSFEFGGSQGVHINVTMDELVVGGAGGNFPSGAQYAGQPACVFGIQNQTNGADEPDAPYLLGDTFLRSAYVVYDLVNNQIGMAPTEFNATKSNVVSFASMSAAIPSSTVIASQNGTSGESTPDDLTAADGFQSTASPLGGVPAIGWAVALASAVVALL